MLAEKIVEDAHIRTLHGGRGEEVSLTMAELRREYWISRLGSLTKKVRKACYGYKKFQTTAFNNPPPEKLPEDRIVGSRTFEVIGVDYAGPIHYRTNNKSRVSKAYLLLFS